MGAFDSGVHSTFDANGAQILLDLKDGIDFLNPKQDGIALLKRIGLNGFTYANQKQEWDETELATRRETITLADAVGTTVTVAKAKQYQVNNLIKCENEVMRVTAIASATTLTVVRGYAGTTAAIHTAKEMFSMGSADPEGSNAPAGTVNTGDRLYNYSQTFTRSVSLTTDQIAALNTEGNPMTGNLERRFIEIMREMFAAGLYGVRFQDTTNEIYAMGGLKSFLTSNVSNVAGALTIAGLDAQIYNIILAGGDPKVIALHPYQKQKLDALDTNIVRQDTKRTVGGGPESFTWKSGLMDHTIDIVVDHTILKDELYVLDTDYIKFGHKEHNGVDGSFKVTDATTPGADRNEKVIRGKYSLRVGQQKSHALLYGLS